VARLGTLPSLPFPLSPITNVPSRPALPARISTSVCRSGEEAEESRGGDAHAGAHVAHDNGADHDYDDRPGGTNNNRSIDQAIDAPIHSAALPRLPRPSLDGQGGSL
jgi:hypothetical protein